MILKYSHHDIFSRLNYNVHVCFVYPGPLKSQGGERRKRKEKKERKKRRKKRKRKKKGRDFLYTLKYVIIFYNYAQIKALRLYQDESLFFFFLNIINVKHILKLVYQKR